MQAKIKFIDEVSGKFGPQFKIKAAPIDGGEDITCYISQEAQLAKGLAKGVVIELDTSAGKFPKIVGIVKSTEEPSSLGESGLKGVYSSTPTTSADFATICATWAAAYEYVHHFLPAAGNEEKLAATSTIFIQAAREKAWVKSDGDE